jgi:hypothetical protein
MEKATKIMKSTLEEVAYLSRKEKKEYILLKLSLVCYKGVSKKGYFKYKWQIGRGANILDNVCRNAFMIAYDLTSYTLETLCGLLKVGSRNIEKDLNDKCNSAAINNNKYLEEIVQFAALQGIKLSAQQLAAL